MALRTWAFAIRFIQSSTSVAHAVICPEAKYVGVRWQDGRLDHRYVPAALWPELESELAGNLAKEGVSRSGLISTVLVGSMGAVMLVTFVEVQSVKVKNLDDAKSALDEMTRSVQPV